MFIKVVCSIYICLACLLTILSVIISLMSDKYEFNSVKEQKLYRISLYLSMTVLLMLVVGLCAVIGAMIFNTTLCVVM